MKRNIIIFTLIAAMALLSLSKADPVLSKILGRYHKFSSLYHEQKVYIHTDKNIYKTGEHIWFKFYLFNDLHRLDTVSKIGYVELIGPDMNLIDVRILYIKHGVGIGDFLIGDSIPSGLYMIRGYTNLMKNFGENFFFKKLITIKNPKITQLNEKLYLDLKSLQTKKHKLKITYNLDSKQLIAQIPNSIYINVTDYLGNPRQATILLKANGKTIKTEQTDSMGYAIIKITPTNRKKYKIIAYSDKEKGRVELGKPLAYGYQLDASKNKKFFMVKVRAKLPQSNDKQFKTIYLLAERNGRIYFTSFGTASDNSMTFRILRRSLPRGIVHFILFNGQGTPVAQQIAFNDKIKILPIKAWITKTKANQYEIHIQTDSTVFATTSMAITSTDVNDDVNIINYLSLKADVPSAKTQIINSPKIDQYIKTYKWQRYTPSQIWGDKIDTPRFKVQKSLMVKGKVTKLIMDLPVSHTLVTLTVLNSYNDQYQTYTDAHGRFYFKNLSYPDTIMALVEAKARDGSRNVLVYIDKYDTIPASYAPMKWFQRLNIFQLQTPQYQQWQREPGTLHNGVDQVIYMKDVNYNGYTNIFELLKGRVPGYYDMGDQVYFRGPKSITQNTEPLYLLDDVPVDKSTIENLNLEDIERIEIIKNPAYSVIYGAQGANGVIAVYTKKGHFIKRGYAQEIQPGIYTPRKFVALPDSLLLTIPYATYFWNSQLLIRSGLGSSRFHIPHGIRHIRVNIQGVDMNGRIINFNKDFSLSE